MAEKEDGNTSDNPIIDDNIIRIQLRKPCQQKWELRTRNLSPGIRFPTIQLFDSEGNLLVETNDENVSIKTCDAEEHLHRGSKSLREKDFKHYIGKNSIRKHNSVHGDKIYTRIFRTPVTINDNVQKSNKSYVIRDCGSIANIPSKLTLNTNFSNLQINSLETSPLPSDGASQVSSYKSSDNESYVDDVKPVSNETETNSISKTNGIISLSSSCTVSIDTPCSPSENEVGTVLHKSQSFKDAIERRGSTKEHKNDTLPRSKSGVLYNTPHNKVSFLNTYLKSLPTRTSSDPDWFALHRRKTMKSPQNCCEAVEHRELPKFLLRKTRPHETRDNTSENKFINIPTDAATACEMKKRLKMYRRGVSEIEPRCWTMSGTLRKRRHSVVGAAPMARSSSSESVDEADLVLNRLKRRILKNKSRERKRSIGAKYLFDNHNYRRSSDCCAKDWRDAAGGALVRSRRGMGSNISQHSAKGLKGRRARSSGDLCNGDTKSQSESSVCGSVVGDVMGWNRSLPNHLDGNRHLADYSRVNNNYGEFGTYNRSHPKGGRGLRYRVSKSGSDAEPVWKLQDPGFDQGYGSERSPEDDSAPPVVPAVVSLEHYEAGLRAVYPFISDENTFTVVVEKDGRGLGMSVCGGGGLVRIRRLYPPQPAWRTGRLAPKDLLLAANGVPLAGLSTYVENTFTVMERDSRGLGMSVCGGGGLVRIRRLYPPQPAWRTGRLAPKDLLLAANGVPLAGLSTYEALEVLRTAPARVELRVCRPPLDALESVTPPDPPTPPARTPHPPHLPMPQHMPLDPLNCHPMHARLSATTSSATTSSSEGRGRRDASPEPRRELRLPGLDRPLPVYDIQYGEFDIVMTKVNGSLGFTLRKEDHSALGHYVRALVREPALSDSRIQPGDRIVAVNDTPMSNMSHAEAVAFLRACGAEVRLRLYRDHAATPLSPVSPREEPTDSDGPTRPKPPLRPEAVSMLCDLAARRLTPDAADGSRSPCLSPRKFRKLTKDNNHYEQPNNVEVEVETQDTRPDRRPLASPTAPTGRKQKLSLAVPPHGYELNNLDNDVLDARNAYQDDMGRRYEPVFVADSDEPVSMPAELTADEARFKHSSPMYQSAVLMSSDGEHKDDSNGLKKWKAVALSPDSERKSKLGVGVPKPVEIDPVQKENIKPQPTLDSANSEPTIVTVELNRGWNSRLGFSVQSHPDSGQSYISAVYSDSVAARDGRLHRGDVILQVNDENVTSMKTPEVIDLLRLLRGSICITVLRPPNPQ